MDSEPTTKASGAQAAAEEMFPMPALPVLWGARRVRRQIDGRRANAERIISAHCIDRSLGEKALRALSSAARRLAVTGRPVPTDMADAISALEHALGIKPAR